MARDRGSRAHRRRAARWRTRVDLAGAAGARRRVPLTGTGRDAVCFTGCVLDTTPPEGMIDHFWLATPAGSMELLAPEARPFIDRLVGLHDPDELADVFTDAGHDRSQVRRTFRSPWFLRVPATITPVEFVDLFRGRTLSRGPSEVARRDPSAAEVLLRTPRSRVPVEVPGWLYSHMVGPYLRPDLVDTVAWRIDDPEVVVARILVVIDLLGPLLADGIAAPTAAGASAAARLVDERAHGPNVQRLGPARDEGLDWLIRFLSKV